MFVLNHFHFPKYVSTEELGIFSLMRSVLSVTGGYRFSHSTSQLPHPNSLSLSSPPAPLSLLDNALSSSGWLRTLSVLSAALSTDNSRGLWYQTSH